MRTIAELHSLLRATPFPVIGKRVGDFVLYDSLLAGCASRAAHGQCLAPSQVPTPDAETLEYVKHLQAAEGLNDEERAFLRYYGLLDELRRVLARSPLDPE